MWAIAAVSLIPPEILIVTRFFRPHSSAHALPKVGGAAPLRHKAGGVGWGGTEPKQAAYVDDGMLGHPLLDDAWEAAACRCRHQSAPKAAEKRARATWWGGGRTPRTRSCPMTHRQQSPADL